jgi:hypothetical protein
MLVGKSGLAYDSDERDAISRAASGPYCWRKAVPDLPPPDEIADGINSEISVTVAPGNDLASNESYQIVNL